MQIKSVFQQAWTSSQIDKRVPCALIAGKVSEASAKLSRLLDDPRTGVFTFIVFRGNPCGQHIRLASGIHGHAQIRLAMLLALTLCRCRRLFVIVRLRCRRRGRRVSGRLREKCKAKQSHSDQQKARWPHTRDMQFSIHLITFMFYGLKNTLSELEPCMAV